MLNDEKQKLKLRTVRYHLLVTFLLVEIEPRLLQVHSALTFSGTTANCEAMITSASDSIKATMTLKQGNRVVDSWSGSGTGIVFLEGDCKVTKGVTYTLTVEGTRNGVAFEPATITRTC